MARKLAVFACRRLSRLLEYPRVGYLDGVARLADRLPPAAAEPLRRFQRELESLSQGGLEELFCSTFELAPSCPPYLGVHLFGESDPRRSTLLWGLTEAFAARDFKPRAELPDHVAVVLDALALLSGEEREELVELCLLPALEKMEGILQGQGNPYAWLLRAVSGLLQASRASEPVEVAYV